MEFVDGRLINSMTLEPISYASIRIKNKAVGIISNIDGGFKIPFKFKMDKDTLEIFSLGYKTKMVFLSKFSKNSINIISLAESTEALNEVVIVSSKKRKRLNAKEIVKSAIQRIGENFPNEPFSYVGYYRDYQLKEDDYLNLNEAVLEVFDLGFDFEDLKDTQIRIYKYLENHAFIRDSIASQFYDYTNRRKVIPKATMNGRIENEYIRLRLHDAIRNYNIYTYSFVDRLDTDFIKNHKLTLLSDTFFDETPLYNIKISKVLDDIEVLGEIYINKTNFGIHKLEYKVYKKEPPKHLKGPFWNIGVITMDNGKRGKLLYDIKVEYQNYNNKMYLNYISFNNAFDILLPPKFTPIAAKINSDRKRFELIMNNPPLEKDGLKKKNYNLYYQEKKLNIEKIEIKKNKVFIYPKNANVVFNPKIIQYLKTITNKGVAIEIKDVHDIYGNMVNKSEAINYNQFREFFTQKLSLEITNPPDSLFMRKTIPINGNQHIVPPANLSDYWMNSPLKK